MSIWRDLVPMYAKAGLALLVYVVLAVALGWTVDRALLVAKVVLGIAVIGLCVRLMWQLRP